jgi:hypothetical protein
MTDHSNSLTITDIDRIERYLDLEEVNRDIVKVQNNNKNRDPPDNQFYRQLIIPNLDESLIGQLVGYKGKHFKRITNMANVKYIWWNDDIKRIEIWGPEKKLDLACNILRDHHIFVKNKFKN